MEQALIAFGGFVIGALSTGAVEYWLERLRQRKLAHAAERVLWADLRRAAGMLKATRVGGGWWARPAFSLPTSEWDKYREMLVAAVPPADWEALAEAFRELEDLNRFLSAHDQVGSEPPVADNLIAPALADVGTAIHSLEERAGLAPGLP